MRLNANQWEGLAPGRHEVSATLVDLDVRTETALDVHLTAELIDQHHPRPGRIHQPPANRRRALEEHLPRLRALLAAEGQLGQVLETVTTAASDAEALSGIRDLLDCPPDSAALVYNAALRRFGSEKVSVGPPRC